METTTASGAAAAAATGEVVTAADISLYEIKYQDRQSVLQSATKSLERVYTMLQNASKGKHPASAAAAAVCPNLFFSPS